MKSAQQTKGKFATSLLDRRVRLTWSMSETDIEAAKVQFSGKSGHYRYAGEIATVRAVVPENGKLSLFVELGDGKMIHVDSDSVVLQV